ncbi:MAG: nucleotidyltransferase domain-containing protein, partial [Candidatus Acidiferrales bacterium]
MKTLPHLEIIQLCARKTMGLERRERFAALIRSVEDFDALIGASAAHGITPLLCKHLESIACDCLPAAWRDRVCAEFQRNSRRNLFLTVELFKVLDAFEAHGIRAISHKGPALAEQAYCDIALRQFNDLDLVLRQSEIRAAHDVLMSLGYRSEIGWADGPDREKIPGHYAYCDGSGRVNLELHTEATLRYLPVPLRLDELLRRLDTVEIGGRRVEIFAAEDALPMLCVHGAKHLWDRLSWLVDISELTQVARGFNWGRAMEAARQLGAERMMLLGLGVARELIGTLLPDSIEQQIRTDRGVMPLVKQACERFMGAAGSRMGLVQRFQMRAQMSGGGFNGARYALRLTIRPTEEDWERLRLPKLFSP